MTYALAALLVAGIALPHRLDLERVRPSTAIALWASALGLRVLTMLFLVVSAILFLPGTALFNALTHWCWHAVLPLLATHLGLDGHRVADLALILPGFVLAASALSVAFGLARATRAVRRLLARGAIGPGPRDSLIIGGPEVMVAAAGLRRPRVIVSAGALTTLDDEELAASLDHEHGHIARRHRFLFLFAELCRGLARFVPGTRRAMRELTFHLERDADQWALARRHDPCALASAICKAATLRPGQGAALATLGGPGVSERLKQLLDGTAQRSRLLTSTAINATAVTMVAFTVALFALLPATTLAGVQQLGQADQIRHCGS
jgi:hypothetical protein